MMPKVKPLHALQVISHTRTAVVVFLDPAFSDVKCRKFLLSLKVTLTASKDKQNPKREEKRSDCGLKGLGEGIHGIRGCHLTF